MATNANPSGAASELTRLGRAALEAGQLPRACALLSEAVSQDESNPLAWFSLANVHAKLGRQDLAALSFQNAASAAAGKPETDAMARRILSAARDNAALSSRSLLPRDWLPALKDTQLQETWQQALRQLAAAVQQQQQQQQQGPAAGCAAASPAPCMVMGGLGAEATLLARALAQPLAEPGSMAVAQQLQQLQLQQQQEEGAGAASPGHTGPAVISLHADALSQSLAGQIASVNGVEDAVWTLTTAEIDQCVSGLVEQHKQESQKQQQEQEQQQASVPEEEGSAQLRLRTAPLLVCPSACASGLQLEALTRSLTLVGPLLAPGALMCPATVVVKAVLAEGQDLVNMNQVDLPAIEEDTGFDYGPCNELLWRPNRAMQVDKLKWRPLSKPIELTRIAAQELLQSNGQTSRKRVNACGGRGGSLTVPVENNGRFDCLVAWCEYELAPGVVLSYAPPSVAAGAPGGAGSSGSGAEHQAAAVLTPHRWQQVHFMPMRPQVSQGQCLTLDVTLSGNDMRVELDEDSLNHQPPPTANDQPTPSEEPAATASGRSSGDTGGMADPPDAAGLPMGEPLDAAEQCCSSSGGSSSDDEEKHAGAAGGSSRSGANAILPYHLSMLNDRARTVWYRDAIAGAVKRMAKRSASGSSKKKQQQQQPPLVLDIGAGTGLLSMLACKAGATNAVGCERELPLAMAASTLLTVNGCSQAVRLVQAFSTQLTVAAAAAAAPPAAAGKKAAQAKSQQQTKAQQQQQQQPNQLPCRASLVVHEIFGTDPLSEHILPTMRHAQEHLVAPDAEFVPGCFRVVAALASCPSLHASHYAAAQAAAVAADPAAAASPAAGGDAGGSGLDLSPLQPWAPWKAEYDLCHLPDMQLLTQPVPVLHFDLQRQWPLPLQGGETVDAPLCDPTPVAEYVSCGKCRPCSAASASGSSGSTTADCVVYWFDAGRSVPGGEGEGPWLTTAPGSTYYGHWVQSIEFLSAPVAVGRLVKSVAARAAGPVVPLRAAFMLDRVKVQPALADS